MNIEELNVNIFKAFHEHWASVTAGDISEHNSMTISWEVWARYRINLFSPFISSHVDTPMTILRRMTILWSHFSLNNIKMLS